MEDILVSRAKRELLRALDDLERVNSTLSRNETFSGLPPYGDSRSPGFIDPNSRVLGGGSSVLSTTSTPVSSMTGVSTTPYHRGSATESGIVDTTTLYFGIGFGLAGLTVLANLVLSVAALVKCCRRYGDLIHGLTFHLGITGVLLGAYVITGNTVLQANIPDLTSVLWATNCKAFLFAKYFLPGVFICLLVAVSISYQTVRFPPRRARGSLSRFIFALVHGMPWLASAGVLIPVLIIHKDSITKTVRDKQLCVVRGSSSWLAPLLVLAELPLAALICSTCCMGATRNPNRYRRQSQINRNSHQNHQHNQHDGHYYDDEDSDSDDTPSSTRHWKQFRTCRMLMMVVNVLAVITQAPFAIANVLQTLLLNHGDSSLPIPQNTMEVLHWLHLSFYAVCPIFLTVLVLHLEQGYAQLERTLHRQVNKNHVIIVPTSGKDEHLLTDCMLTSV